MEYHFSGRKYKGGSSSNQLSWVENLIFHQLESQVGKVMIIILMHNNFIYVNIGGGGRWKQYCSNVAISSYTTLEQVPKPYEPKVGPAHEKKARSLVPNVLVVKKSQTVSSCSSLPVAFKCITSDYLLNSGSCCAVYRGVCSHSQRDIGSDVPDDVIRNRALPNSVHWVIPDLWGQPSVQPDHDSPCCLENKPFSKQKGSRLWCCSL